MPKETPAPKRKVRKATKPYVKPATIGRPRKDATQPSTSAIVPPKHQRKVLTVADWQTVVSYVDAHPELKQAEVVDYFKNRKEGALIFTQATLSRHLSKEGREADLGKASANPTALSSKRIRIVTNPEVEKALWLWVRHMEAKNEQVTGPMLVTKRAVFEEQMDVPEEERLKSASWVQNFLRT